MYPKTEETQAPPATAVTMSGSPGGNYQGPADDIPATSTVHAQAPPANVVPMSGVPAAFAVQAQAPIAAWSTGLCDCFDDCGNCCVTCFCPCITFGQIAEIVDRGSSSCGGSGALYTLIMMLTGCQCVYSCFYRAKIRAQYGIRETPCADCCVHWCCHCCALCQEYRELNNRGFMMNIGWHANIERQRRTAATTPPQMQPGMTR